MTRMSEAAGRSGVLRSLRPRRWDAISAVVVVLLVLPDLAPRHGGPPGVGFDLALAIPLLWRSRWPFPVFLVIAGIAFVQWLVGVRVLGDVALLVAMYTVASREEPGTVLAAAAILELGVILALARWFHDAHIRSFVGLTGLVVAATMGQLASTFPIAGCSTPSRSGRRGSSVSATSRAASRPRPSGPGSPASCTTSSRTTSR